MNDYTEVLPAPLQEDSFDIVMRGYSRGQVDEYIKRTKRQLEELESRLARAEREAEDARRDRDRSRNDAATAQRKLESHEPSYEDLGERLTQILKLAQEEAEERREQVVSEAERSRAEAQQEADGIRGEIDQKRSEAATEADQLRSQAREESERVRGEAEDAAERLRVDAGQRAEQLIGEAEQRSREIEEGANQRVQDLEHQHGELLEQLSTVRDSLQTLLPQRNLQTGSAGPAGPAGPAGVAATEPPDAGVIEDAGGQDEETLEGSTEINADTGGAGSEISGEPRPDDDTSTRTFRIR